MKSRFKGVYWSKQKRKWKAILSISGESIYLGSFPIDQEERAGYIVKRGLLLHRFGITSEGNDIDSELARYMNCLLCRKPMTLRTKVTGGSHRRCMVKSGLYTYHISRKFTGITK